jgi:hypothetical protein
MSTDLATKRVKWEDLVPLPNNPVDERRLDRILGNGGFSSQKAGTPEACLNDASAFPDLSADSLIVADGNNRRELAIRAGKGQDTTIVKIHKGLTRAEIARLFLGLNDYRQHRANEIFVRRVEAEERKAVEINEVVTATGWHVPVYSNATGALGGIAAVAALEWVFDGAPNMRLLEGKKLSGRQSVALMRTLTSIAAIYGTGAKVAQGNVIKGFGAFYLRYGEKVNVERLHERISESLPTVKKLLSASETWRETLNCIVPETVGRTLRAHYNGPRRGKHDLAEW